MTRRPATRVEGEGGFTLVEVMVALLIFAILAAAGVSLLSFSVRAQAASGAKLDDLGALNRTLSILSADLAQASARAVRDEAGTPLPAFVGESSGDAQPMLRLVRGGWTNLDATPRAGLQKVAYRLDGGVLQRLAYPQLDGAAPLPPAPLLDRVRRVALRYRFRGAWSDRWDGAGGIALPQALELRVERDNGVHYRQLFLVGTGYVPTPPAAPRTPPMHPAERERGAALLTVLMLVAVIAVIAAGALEKLRLATRLSGNATGIEQARSYAEAAEALALSRVDQLLGASPDRVVDTGWSDKPFGLPLPGGTAVARVTDGGNCFNLNALVTTVAPGVYASNPAARVQFARLMRVLGTPAAVADQVAAGTSDWIDTDADQQAGGAEDAQYLGHDPAYRTAGTLMADPSELRAVAGVTPELFAQLRPWLCTLPIAAASAINVNTLTPAQAPLAAMLGDGLSVDAARAALLKRPAQGWGDPAAFWTAAGAAGGGPAGVTSRWFALRIDVTAGRGVVTERALIDATRLPARLVSRQWGEDL